MRVNVARVEIRVNVSRVEIRVICCEGRNKSYMLRE